MPAAVGTTITLMSNVNISPMMIHGIGPKPTLKAIPSRNKKKIAVNSIVLVESGWKSERQKKNPSIVELTVIRSAEAKSRIRRPIASTRNIGINIETNINALRIVAPT